MSLPLYFNSLRFVTGLRLTSQAVCKDSPVPDLTSSIAVRTDVRLNLVWTADGVSNGFPAELEMITALWLVEPYRRILEDRVSLSDTC